MRGSLSNYTQISAPAQNHAAYTEGPATPCEDHRPFYGNCYALMRV